MAAVSVGGGGRNIGVAMDFSACSKAALRWAAASLARPGDRLVLVHVKPSFHAAMIPLVELADPRVSRIYGVAPDAETIGILTSAANQKGVEVVAKVYWGEPAKKLTEAAQGIPLHWLVVGNRGLGAGTDGEREHVRGQPRHLPRHRRQGEPAAAAAAAAAATAARRNGGELLLMTHQPTYVSVSCKVACCVTGSLGLSLLVHSKKKIRGCLKLYFCNNFVK
uniref:UspA domain-containing protein n=1 Tax=Oryza nivara TaxID=4536 RepID=A0A0E0HA56_ORYNI